ncbi:MAG: hydantoinase B/oxoprolinase family protein, partial [Thermoanaerobaculia bacterium]
FLRAYEDHYGYRPERRPVEVESIRVVASSRERPQVGVEAVPAARAAEPEGRRRAYFAGAWRRVAVFDRERLEAGCRLEGPCLVFERHSATVVESGWWGRVDAAAGLVLGRHQSADGPPRRGDGGGELMQSAGSRGAGPARAEAIERELFSHRFSAIAWQMGEVLRRTALSVNVKERLDFSCALLDPQGELVVNAPHIPVHLGALGLCVRTVRDRLALGPGDVAVTNHPAFGGTHLPDVTVITPVFGEGGGLLGYVASRAHHAEIGGSRPGSMPPDARRLVEEGVVLEPQYLVRGGEARWEAIRRRLTEAPYPSRAVRDNLADLAAAAAANHRGAEGLRSLAVRHGAGTVAQFMTELTGQASEQVQAALGRFREGCYEALERLDDGSPLRVAIHLKQGAAEIDFTGSARVHPGNLNATPAVVRSVVLYVLRLLIDEPLPLNEGLLRTVRLTIPPGILNPPFPEDPREAPAVVGGNVETSQRLVDTLLKALEVAACSQGTMNNLLFGNERFGYYETVCGGCGAGPGFDGASAVHSHMTNTAITDPELLEHRYPVRVERFAIRRGSGGAGRWRGGDGAVRELTFLEQVSVSLVSQHRSGGPYGLRGGGVGLPGRQRLVRSSGEVVELEGVDRCEAAPGDRLILETPGGGGWGPPEEEAK